MMREIKFRGKSEYTGEWVYGFGVGQDKYSEGYFIQTKIDDYEFVKEETIGQFTGLYDKNGKEIYEGDIVRGKKGNYKVIYFKNSFCLFDVYQETILSLFDLFEQLECIGNIHD